MIENNFDVKVKIQDIVINQLPEFILTENPNASEFLKQYYISQEYAGSAVDILDNLSDYLKLDYLIPEVISNNTILQEGIDSSNDVILVNSTKGFPSKYGLLKIDDEIITYTGITTNTFTGCIRGFSGITDYHETNNPEELVFSTSQSSSHSSNSAITNLSSLFLKEFFNEIKYLLTPGLENIDFSGEINVSNFIKEARSFYQSKGTEESFRILFKVLYAEDVKVLDLEKYLLKPSSAEFLRKEIIVAERISGDPTKIIGQEIYSSIDPETRAAVSNVEIIRRGGKYFYHLSLFIGYTQETSIRGSFYIHAKTKVVEKTFPGSEIITVDSTVGFPSSGTLICGDNTIEYSGKTLNQFYGCQNITETINSSDDIRIDEHIVSYEDGDTSKEVRLRISGVIDGIEDNNVIYGLDENEYIRIKSIGEIIPNRDESDKQIFANSWVYNTSSRYQIKSIAGSTLVLASDIDKSSLKLGDQIEILIRETQDVVTSETNIATVSSITYVGREISLNGLTDLDGNPFNPLDPQKSYYGRYFDLRRKLRKAKSSNIPIQFGNDKLVSNILNVYNEYDQYFYVASNGLPSYTIEKNIIQKTIQNATSTFLNDQDPITDKYTTIKIKEIDGEDNPFRTGDEIVYQSELVDIPELISGKKYYTEVVSNNNIKLYESRSFIGSSNYIKFSPLSESDGSHTFTLSSQNSNQIGRQSIVRKFPITRDFELGNKFPTKDLKSLGLMCNGVEIFNPGYDDKVYYGPINSVKVLNGGSNYDVVNPPYVEVSSSIGNTCLVQPVISGSIVDVIVDPQDFDIEQIISVDIVGGNGKNCVLQPFLSSRYREVLFDGRLLANGGGMDITYETITFLIDHKFENGQKIIYSSEGNDVGIGIYGGSNLGQNRTLVDGGAYYAKVINNKTIQLYESLENFNVGFNTVGFTTTNLYGTHRFRTLDKGTLSYIKVVNGGENYQNRQLIVKSSGISTQKNTVTFTDHNFNDGDLIQYSSSGAIISGLSTLREYYVNKLDHNSFRLSDAGLIGNNDTSNFDRKEYVSFASTGSGYHTFKYPDIKINVVVSYASTFIGIVTATPIVRGKFVDAYVYESGTGYGSTVLNFQKKPIIRIKIGKDGYVRPIIVGGKIVRVEVESAGRDYYSVPRLEVVGDGFGAKLRAIIKNRRLSSVVVIDQGEKYTTTNTKIKIISDGSGVFLDPSIRYLQVNNLNRYGDEVVVGTNNNNLSYGYFGYNSSIAVQEFNDDGSKHSPIIGWAYDGNPIYGSYGYSDPEDPQSPIKALVSGYKLTNNIINDRPVGFSTGFFADDYAFNDTEDLDFCNGRWCKTPQFPNGTYAYFATIDTVSNSAAYPYFIGNYYRLPFIEDNLRLDQTIDINDLGLIRNTFPYKINEKYADNDFIIESNEVTNQKLNVDLVSSGSVNSVSIIESGSDYKVNDRLIVTNQENDDGVGFNAIVSEVFGKVITSIETSVEKYDSFTFIWDNSSEISGYISTYHGLLDNDVVTISGISSFVSGLENNHAINVENNIIYLFSELNPSSRVVDINVSKVIDCIKPDTILKIDDEELTVLNTFENKNILRVVRGDVGASHTTTTAISVNPNRITFPLKTNYFNSQLNNRIYFNPSNSIGIGTTSGVSTPIVDQIGNETINNSVYTQTIYLPNHKFKTGDLVKLNLPLGSLSGFLVTQNPAQSPFDLPSSGLSQDVYVINKTKDTIGIVTSRSLVNTSAGLYFLNLGNSNGFDYEYYLESNFNQVTGTVAKVKSLVSLSTSHTLQTNDVIRLDIKPNSTDDTVKLFYKNYLDQIVVNSKSFANSGVNTSSNQIEILNHGFVTGDKVFYHPSIGSNISGLTTSNYFVYKIDDDTLKLSKTFSDVSASPPKFIDFSSTGGTLHTLSLVHPPLISYKNNNLSFDLSDSSLDGFKFKIYYDKEFNKEYVSSSSENEFNVVGFGTVGISSDASTTINYSNNLPQFLYYSLEKSGRILSFDPDVKYSSRISFENSLYNGSYTISPIVVGNASSEFYITLNQVPEKLSYTQNDCDVLRYYTRSKNDIGGISDVDIVYGGYGYKKIPNFENIESEFGSDGFVELKSSSIGKLEKVTVINQGYEYSVDKSIRPDAYIPPRLNLKNTNKISSVEVLDGGKNYLSPPSITIFDPYDNVVINSGVLIPKLSSSSIGSIEIFETPYGLSSVNHKIYTENNTNGISISEIDCIDSVVTCTLVTPILGFNINPFSVGDKIFVEGIQKYGQDGTGFNSKDYNYEFFTVTNYIPSSPAILEFDLSELTINPGIAVTFSPNPVIVNKINYPEFKVVQEVAYFVDNENLLLKVGSNFNDIDLKVISFKSDVLKVDGSYDQLEAGDIIKGKLTGVVATINSVNLNSGILKISYSSKQNRDWENNLGKLNEEYQVLPNNDYFQNLSYSVRSSKTYEELSGPVNQLLHPIGLKNFADVQVSSSATIFNQQQGETVSTTVLDISTENRVDTINNFDLSLDVNVDNQTSRFIRFKNKRLTNYINCISNIGLRIDDISPLFSNLDNREPNTSSSVDLIDYNNNFSNFLIEIKDPDSGNIQFLELVTLSDDENVFTLEKSVVCSTDNLLANIYGYTDTSGEQSLALDPIDPYGTNLDIKVLKTNFSSTSNVGIGSEDIGFINLWGSISTVGVGSETSILTVYTQDTSALYANIHVLNLDNNESNFVDLYITHDGTNSYLSEYYFDTTEGQLSSNFIGTFTSNINSGILTLECDNISANNLLIRSKIVGFGSTSLGISTYRFKPSNQPAGDELTCRLQSNYVNSIGSTSILSTNIDEISSIKSLVKVSIGNTIAMHQVMMVKSGTGDIIIKQYPILSIGSTLGIGTFGSVENGTTMDMYFYPDPSHTGVMEIQSYNHMFYNLYDELNEPELLEYANITESYYLRFFDSINGGRYDKFSFDMRSDGVPIYTKTFNPQNSLALDPVTGIFTIKNHFFNTGEQLVYTPGSTFSSILPLPLGIGATLNSSGIVTTILPSDVYAIKLTNDQFQLSTRSGFSTLGIAVTFTSLGSGNSHQLDMTKKLTKTVISLDGVVQSPIKWTPISHNLVYNGGQISDSATTFSLSGISTVFPKSILKIDNEYVEVISVGFGTLSSGPITGIGTYNLIYVSRSVLGSAATHHSDSSVARVYTGSYDIVNNKIHFVTPPKGQNSLDETPSNLPRLKSKFSGRVFLRQNYATNTLYDDIFDQFSGIGQTSILTVQGINTTGIETGSSLVFINDIFQTPTTENNSGNNYFLEEDGPKTKIVFTGITSTNGDLIISDYDVNQNQLPRNGLIISVGSTPGLGFAPLVGASLTSWTNRVSISGGSIIAVSIGSSDYLGSGYYGEVSIGVTQSNHTGNQATIRANIGSGGTITGFSVLDGGSGYSANPSLIIPEPKYENLSVEGIFRKGIGFTTETGTGLLMNLEVSASPGSVGIGSTLFQVSSFKITRPGYGFKIGDVFKPVGLVTAKGFASPISDFAITVTDIFTDSFSSWQFGELDYMDSIKPFQNGSRKRFPLRYKGELLTFETDDPTLDLNSVLIIFIDGIIQDPGISYNFTGGSSFAFTEAPKPENNVAIFFYRGSRDIDTVIVDVIETIKPGDTVQMFKNSYIPESLTQNQRTVVGIQTSDEIETNLYRDQGIETDSNKYKPLSWTKQKSDKIFNGEYFYKSRDSLESLVYPTAKIIRSVQPTDTEIFVDDARFFNYEEDDPTSSIQIIDFNAKIIPQVSLVAASATCVVSSSGTIQSVTILNGGSGYTGATVELKIASPRSTYVGIGSTAEVIATVVNGSLSSPITITKPGFGYTTANKPNIIAPFPEFNFEDVSDITTVQGFSGIITSITATTGTGSNPLAIKFGLRISGYSLLNVTNISSLNVGYPIFIFDTKVGNGVTSIYLNDSDLVGIGTNFLNNIYTVASISPSGINGEIIVNVKSNSNLTGINSVGTNLGKFSWGRFSSMVRKNPISIGISGYTVDVGLSTFPTIQRRGYGFKSSGSVDDNLIG